MDEGIDTGDILSQRSIPIEPDDTGGSLFNRLATLGGDVLLETIPDYISGRIVPKPQAPSPTPYAPMLKKTDGKLDFQHDADFLSRQVRAYHPWPSAYTHWQGKRLKIIKGQAVASKTPGIGVRIPFNDKPAIGTSRGILVLDEVQLAGKVPMSGEAFLLGVRDWESGEQA
jgi:methionyl-tRNA formyltransferase